MTLHWKHTDKTLETYWQYTGNILTLHWKHTDITLETYWQYTGHILTLHWKHTDKTLKHTDNTLETYWQYTDNTVKFHRVVFCWISLPRSHEGRLYQNMTICFREEFSYFAAIPSTTMTPSAITTVCHPQMIPEPMSLILAHIIFRTTMEAGQ